MEIIKLQKNDIRNALDLVWNVFDVYHRLGFFETDKERTVNGIRFTPMSYFRK